MKIETQHNWFDKNYIRFLPQIDYSRKDNYGVPYIFIGWLWSWFSVEFRDE